MIDGLLEFPKEGRGSEGTGPFLLSRRSSLPLGPPGDVERMMPELSKAPSRCVGFRMHCRTGCLSASEQLFSI
jgi:hypothetical protein